MTEETATTILYQFQREKRKQIDKVYQVIYYIVLIYIFASILLVYIKAFTVLSILSIGVIAFITLILIFKNKTLKDIEDIDEFYLANEYKPKNTTKKS